MQSLYLPHFTISCITSFTLLYFTISYITSLLHFSVSYTTSYISPYLSYVTSFTSLYYKLHYAIYFTLPQLTSCHLLYFTVTYISMY